MSFVPQKQQKVIASSLDKADRTFALAEAAGVAAVATEEAAAEYRTLHVEVRAIQRDVRRIEAEIKSDRDELENFMRGGPDVDQDRMRELEARIRELDAEREAVAATIPRDWEAEHERFREIQATEEKARKAYRRNIDDAYMPIRELLDVLAATDELAALEGRLVALRERIPDAEPAESVDNLAAMAKAVGGVTGTKKIRSDLSGARRALRAKKPDMDKALKKYDSAIKKYRAELTWRQMAAVELLTGLEIYEAAIRDTIGLRQQPRMPHEQALELVGCTAKHRDISLHF
jgi:flagellar biosynthesis chaperone FliJ